MVFPVSTGMNRSSQYLVIYIACVPRKHGDEPLADKSLAQSYRCSP